MIRATRWILSLVGALLVAAGFFLGWKGFSLAVLEPRQAEAGYAELSAQPVYTTIESLRDLPAGRRVLVSGRLADEGAGRTFPLITGGTVTFVAYAIYRTDTTGGIDSVTSTISVVEEEVTPPLAVQLSAGTVRIVNRGYELAGAGPSVGVVDGKRSVIGHAAGESLLVDATIVRGTSGPALQAKAISVTRPEVYLRGLEPEPDSVAWASFFGYVAGLLGVLLALTGLGFATVAFGLRRARRPATETGQ